MTASPTRYCRNPDCGKALVKRPRETWAEFNARKHCSIKCKTTKPHDPCGNCGGEVVRREGESMKWWRGRTCCSRECADAKMKEGKAKNRIIDWVEPASKSFPVSFYHQNLTFPPDYAVRLVRPESLPGVRSTMGWAADADIA